MHAGGTPCPIRALHLLEIDHTKGNGAFVRSALRPRGAKTYRGDAGGRLARYLRAIADPDHGMQVLCANCHRWRHARERDAVMLAVAASLEIRADAPFRNAGSTKGGIA